MEVDMIQDQLVDYISSQMKLGISRDAIKSALVSAGWVAADVEDTLKKIEGSGGSAAQPAAASNMNTKPAASAMSSSSKGSEPQMIRVSDLVSASPASVAVSSASSSKPMAAVDKSKISGNTFQAMPMEEKKKPIGMIIAGFLALVFAGLAWYFYSGNAGLATQVGTLTKSSTDLTSQLSALKSQIDASSTQLSAQVATLTKTNAELALELSFFAASGNSTASGTPASAPATITGWLTSTTKGYFITTALGSKITIANPTAATLAPQFKSFVGDSVQLVGTYIPGSDEITVTSITNLSPAPATPPPAAASTTTPVASSTASSSAK